MSQFKRSARAVGLAAYEAKSKIDLGELVRRDNRRQAQLDGPIFAGIDRLKIECLPHRADAQVVDERRRKGVRVGQNHVPVDLVIFAVLAHRRVCVDAIAGRLVPCVRVPEEDRVRISEPMIHAEAGLCPLRLRQCTVLKILAEGERIGGSTIGGRPEIENLAGDRIEAARRNNVPWELIAYLGPDRSGWRASWLDHRWE